MVHNYPGHLLLHAGKTAEFTVTFHPPLISSGEANRYVASLEINTSGHSPQNTSVPIELLVGAVPDFDLNITPGKGSDAPAVLT